MQTAEKEEETDVTPRESISFAALVDRLGERAAAELFVRLDGASRTEHAFYGLTVRESRTAFTRARTSGQAQFVVPGRPTRGHAMVADFGESVVIIKMEDLEAVVRAGQERFDWTAAFSARADLPAATSSATLLRGSRGRRLLRA